MEIHLVVISGEECSTNMWAGTPEEVEEIALVEGANVAGREQPFGSIDELREAEVGDIDEEGNGTFSVDFFILNTETMQVSQANP